MHETRLWASLGHRMKMAKFMSYIRKSGDFICICWANHKSIEFCISFLCNINLVACATHANYGHLIFATYRLSIQKICHNELDGQSLPLHAYYYWCAYSWWVLRYGWHHWLTIWVSGNTIYIVSVLLPCMISTSNCSFHVVPSFDLTEFKQFNLRISHNFLFFARYWIFLACT